MGSRSCSRYAKRQSIISTEPPKVPLTANDPAGRCHNHSHRSQGGGAYSRAPVMDELDVNQINICHGLAHPSAAHANPKKTHCWERVPQKCFRVFIASDIVSGPWSTAAEKYVTLPYATLCTTRIPVCLAPWKPYEMSRRCLWGATNR